jgi:hypothetical protein
LHANDPLHRSTCEASTFNAAPSSTSTQRESLAIEILVIPAGISHKIVDRSSALATV